jgi:hypothetical protein
LGVTMICFAISPKSVAKSAVACGQQEQSREIKDEDTNKPAQEYYVAYEAIVPAIQLHLLNDVVLEFDLYVLEEKDFEPAVKKPLYVNNHLKILFSRIISPNAP